MSTARQTLGNHWQASSLSQHCDGEAWYATGPATLPWHSATVQRDVQQHSDGAAWHATGGRQHPVGRACHATVQHDLQHHSDVDATGSGQRPHGAAWRATLQRDMQQAASSTQMVQRHCGKMPLSSPSVHCLMCRSGMRRSSARCKLGSCATGMPALAKGGGILYAQLHLPWCTSFSTRWWQQARCLCACVCVPSDPALKG